MSSRLSFGIFVAVAVAQLGLPASMIWRSERALTGGREYRFRTAPVDPYDAFRGRYVALRFEQETAPWKSRTAARQGQAVFVLIEEDTDGFVRLGDATPEPPSAGGYLAVRVRWVEGDNAVHVELPFNRFYMAENAAPRAERAYAEHSRRGQQDAYAVVRITDGRGVIANLYVGGKPIAQFIREQTKPPSP